VHARARVSARSPPLWIAARAHPCWEWGEAPRRQAREERPRRHLAQTGMTTRPRRAKRARPPRWYGLGSGWSPLRSLRRGKRGFSQLAGHERLRGGEERFNRLAHLRPPCHGGVVLRRHLRHLPLCAHERGHAMGFATGRQRLEHALITGLQQRRQPAAQRLHVLAAQRLHGALGPLVQRGRVQKRLHPASHAAAGLLQEFTGKPEDMGRYRSPTLPSP
jgi:hypothetical protein